MDRGLTVVPVGTVRGGREEPVDDDWGAVTATIELDPGRFGPDAVAGLAEFSHLEVVYLFHLLAENKIALGARRPRENPDWPRVGIFAQRGKSRLNRLGVSRCELLAVDGLRLAIRGLDAVAGTPVLDVKPWMGECAAGPDAPPAWSSELMKGYW